MICTDMDKSATSDICLAGTTKHVAADLASSDFHGCIAIDATCYGIDLGDNTRIVVAQVDDSILAITAAEDITEAISLIGDYPLV